MNSFTVPVVMATAVGPHCQHGSARRAPSAAQGDGLNSSSQALLHRLEALAAPVHQPLLAEGRDLIDKETMSSKSRRLATVGSI